MPVDRSEYIEDIQKVAEDIGRPPNSNEYDNNGRWSRALVYSLGFKNWNEALTEAGFDPSDMRKNHEFGQKGGPAVTRKRFLEDVAAVAESLSRPPNTNEYSENGRWTNQLAYHLDFASWPDVLEKAGLDPKKTEHRGNGSKTQIERADLIEELKAAGLALERAPSRSEMDEFGDYSSHTYVRRFGSWAEALEIAGFEDSEITDPHRTAKTATQSNAEYGDAQ